MFQDKVFESIIPRNVRLSEAPSHGQSIFTYDNRSVGAKKYLSLAKELDRRVYGQPEVESPTAQESAPSVPPPVTTEKPNVPGEINV